VDNNLDPILQTGAQAFLGQNTQDDIMPAHSTVLIQVDPLHVGTEILSSSICSDEVLFDRYQRLMAPNMPFYVVPDGSCASSLARSEPFLMHAIRVVTYFHDTSQQQVLAEGLMRQICERLLMGGEKSLGLLQGLLIFSNWYNPHVYSPQNSTNLLHLAIALTTDLNIDRGPGTCEKARMESALRAYGVAHATKTLTNEERRAVLGTFYLTSVMFTSFRKVETIRWTPWLAACANTLRDSNEYESDSRLVKLVHMQRIMQESTSVEAKSAPCQTYANSFFYELENMRCVPGHGTMMTVLQLQEACTKTAIWQRSFAGLSKETTEPNDLRRRLDGMWRCMEAAKSFMDLYMEVPTTDYLTIPFGVFSQFAYTFVVIVRALSLEIDGWDVAFLHEFINLSGIIENASRRYEAVSQASLGGLSLKNEAFANWGIKLRIAKAFLDAKRKSASSSSTTAAATTTTTHFNLGFDQESDLAHRIPVPGQGCTLQPPALDPMTDAFQPFMGFEDFWTGFTDLSQNSADSHFAFGSV
jgi:hypothetical protein